MYVVHFSFSFSFLRLIVCLISFPGCLVLCKSVPKLTQLQSPTVIPASVDPHVAGFLKSVLGSRKWRIFSSKLCERKEKDAAGTSTRTRSNEAGSSGAALKQRAKAFFSASFPDEEDGVLHGGTSPCAIAFLVKVSCPAG